MTMLDQLLVPGAIRMLFQPILRIFDDDIRLYSLEALARGPAGTSMERPDVLFEYARRKGEESRIDRLCIAAALEAAATLPNEPHISVNVHGSTISSPPDFAVWIAELAAQHGIAPQRIIVELLEHRPPTALESLRAALADLRAIGIRIALDDLGVGASNYHMFVDCRPDHLKIDRYLVQGCSSDAWRRAVLRSIVTLGAACGALPIAEGIENAEDLAAVRAAGIDHVQGWLYSPGLTPLEITASPFFNERFSLQ